MVTTLLSGNIDIVLKVGWNFISFPENGVISSNNNTTEIVNFAIFNNLTKKYDTISQLFPNSASENQQYFQKEYAVKSNVGYFINLSGENLEIQFRKSTEF